MSDNKQNENIDHQRFKRLHTNEMTADQKHYFNGLMNGRVSGTGSKGVVQGATSLGAPFNVLLRSPVLAERLRNVGEYLRFDSSIPKRLNELAILVTARAWTAQYEWYAHLRLALKEGLNPALAAELAQGKRPSNMQADEQAIYNFCDELHKTHQVSDAHYKAVIDLFGEQGAVDLMVVCGYYVMVSMVLNVNRTPLPEDAVPIPEL
ncbi:MAG: carboxymuconolactone decarboxylase family protein [Burkholderiaceae bacterium]|nr:carboxymuconolactone decarboxylase family protein [Burkholderiaceae bacterium]